MAEMNGPDLMDTGPFDPAAPVGEHEVVRPRLSRRGRLLRAAVLFVLWLATTLVVGSALFLNSERVTTVAGHDAQVSPHLGREALLSTGPVLPDVRIAIDSPVGVQIALGKTDAATTEELFARYALIVSNPESQVDKIVDLVVQMAASAFLRGAAAGLVPVVVYLILGPGRRREMWDELRTLRPRPVLALLLVAAVLAALWQPWFDEEPEIAAERRWMTLGEFLGDGIPVPDAADSIEVRADATAEGTKKLVGSLVDTWDKSQTFYDDATEAAAALELRAPSEGETVSILVSDRHDNVGMDRVARAVADRAGATGILGGGDDTSTGRAWEAFSLDSLDTAFKDLDRWAVTGNHDHGSFVGDYFTKLGWTVLDGEVVEGPGGGRLLGVPDPRSSGLGSWRDEKGISFSEAQKKVADLVCVADAEERINTLLVHDPNLGRIALARGCADLVIGGHHHVDKGPDSVEGENGQVGYTFTNGTTGGAAYAVAVGSKPKRDAQMSLITYDANGRPAGLQLVTLRTDGQFEVDPFVAFSFPEFV